MHLPAEVHESSGNVASPSSFRPVIFVVEDDEDIARLISHNLQASGFEVQSFVSGASVLTEAVREMPALFLLAKTGEADRVKGLELGGDDYITKPFSPRELVARIRSVLRGLGQVPAAGEVMKLGDLEIDVSSMTVQAKGNNVLTTVREFRLLEYLATHRGRVLTRDQLLDAV